MSYKPLDRAQLSPREAEIWALSAQGLSYPQIARKLGVSEGTVRGHAWSIGKRWNLPKRTRLADVARQKETV